MVKIIEKLTVKEYAQLRGCSRQYVIKLVKEGTLRAEENVGELGGGVGGVSYLIPLASIDPKLAKKYLRQQR